MTSSPNVVVHLMVPGQLATTVPRESDKNRLGLIPNLLVQTMAAGHVWTAQPQHGASSFNHSTSPFNHLQQFPAVQHHLAPGPMIC
jgi:hypothetical protein